MCAVALDSYALTIMSNLIDILVRVEAICKKYEKYDAEKKAENQVSSNDHFLRLHNDLETEIAAATAKSAEAAAEKNRALVATLNAEVRRIKASLRKELPKLTKLAGKKVKGVKPEELAARPELVVAITNRIEEIPDGIAVGKKVTNKKEKPKVEIRFDNVSPETLMESGKAFEHSEESKSFDSEAQSRMQKQDQGLDIISEGLSTLKNMAIDMGEELEKQSTMMDEIDSRVEKASSDLKSNNTRMKDVVTHVRSSRNFCIDIILLSVILGIAAALYQSIKRKKG